MITKAYIVEISKDGYSAKVRIPLYNKVRSANGATSDKNLIFAPICTPPGYFPAYIPGDIVFVDFEEDNLSKPMIIGCLYCENGMKSSANVKLQSLEVSANANLSSETYIGDMNPDDVDFIHNSLKDKLDVMEQKIDQGGGEGNTFEVNNERLDID